MQHTLWNDHTLRNITKTFNPKQPQGYRILSDQMGHDLVDHTLQNDQSFPSMNSWTISMSSFNPNALSIAQI